MDRKLEATVALVMQAVATIIVVGGSISVSTGEKTVHLKQDEALRLIHLQGQILEVIVYEPISGVCKKDGQVVLESVRWEDISRVDVKMCS